MAQNLKKPNIVFIFTDDQTYSAVHALGNSEIHTPNIDRLVRMGTSFTNAYNMGAWNGAVCVASRAMIISGRSVWQAKEMGQYWKRGDSLEKTWGKLMERGGYTTYMTGKWHVDADPLKVFNVVKHVRAGMAGSIDPAKPSGYNRPKNVTDTAWKSYDSSLLGFWEGGKHWNEVLSEDAIDFIETASGKNEPFFMYIASNAPHDPRQAPKKYWDMYPLENISLPKSWLPEYPFKEAIGNGMQLRDEALAPFPRTAYAIKSHIREYYASITYLDVHIGRILDALEQSGKMENTYIFFTSDHGLSVGRHGLMGKQSLFEHSVKPPLVITGPGIPKNKKVEAPVYLQDIMATSLEVADIQKPKYVEFNSLISLAKATKAKSNYPAIYGSYLNLERSIHVGDYKLILYPAIKKALLFNLKSDPEEMKDLSVNPRQKRKVKEMFKKLMVLQKTMDDSLDLTSWYNQLQ